MISFLICCCGRPCLGRRGAHWSSFLIFKQEREQRRRQGGGGDKEEEEEQEKKAWKGGAGGEEERQIDVVRSTEEGDMEKEASSCAGKGMAEEDTDTAGCVGLSRAYAIGGTSLHSQSMSAVSSLPLSRVKRLIKSEGGVQLVTAEANILITKATELFLESFVERAYERMLEDTRYSLQYNDVAHAVAGDHRLDFLSDIIPQKVLVSKLLPSLQPPPPAGISEAKEMEKGNGVKAKAEF
ncbi:hypothetical protein CBR_g30333 [Chara braunii]|uniref:Transcription factor CBF/NF-Y/archaeal histone domain-containing protein n=1 Tax=Chara braunii TaxID=69332 RepID=A0A388JX55_CHABU|nr:hypothetical protein CBR_g30333 [Chara braunii]|eukprot:GBG62379.1 hypothetical protein CBR_g30333 [Chara braunii]